MSAQKIPYPPTPADVPEGLTDYAESYTKQQNLLLAGLFVFLIFYLGAVVFFAMLATWCALTLKHLFVVKLIGLILSFTFFLYLVKGFFKRHAMDKEMHIEITEDEHPVLFGFIDQLCEELGAPKPNKVFVSPDVNAAVMPRTSLINLFVEPKKDLLIGMGLVNCVNLSEFKAVLAHEFGHFGQSAMGSSYAYVASRIIGDLVEGEDWFDRFINWCKRQDNAISIFGNVVGGCLWVGRKILEWLYKVITLQRLAVSREREFHADLVAVSAAGSDAVVHCLLRTEFGHMCFMQAINDMATALDHKLYSKDMYLHQDRASVIVRRKKKEKELGLPPALKGPKDGKSVHVFDAEEEEIEDDIPPMWRTHPRNSEREENAKEQFVAAVADHRSPWMLFADAADLRERMTYKFYRMYFRVPKNTDLTDAQKVQEYIDNEHAETTYDPKYHGAYDDRPIEPGELSELNQIIADSPWNEERMEKVYDKIFDGCKEHAEAHADLHKELASLRSNVVGKPSKKMKEKIEDVEKDMEENWEWFKSFDRRVYLLHVQMADAVDKELKAELIERYRFQLEVQRFFQQSRENYNKSDSYISAYFAAARGEIQVPNDFGAEVIAVLRAAWKALKKIIQDAKEVNLPALKNFVEGDRLSDFILEGKLVPEPPLSELKGAWVHKLMTQLEGVKNKCFRLHFKSLGGILALQEKVAAAWNQARTPVAAEVEGFFSGAEDVVEAEVLDAEPARVYTSVDEVVVESLTRRPDGTEYPLDEDVVEGEVLDAAVVEGEAEPSGLQDAPMSLDEIRVESVGSPGMFTTAAFSPKPAATHAARHAVPPVTPAPVEAEVIEEVEVIEEAEVLDAAVVEEPAPAEPAVALTDNPFTFDPEPVPATPPPPPPPKSAVKPPPPKPAPAPVEAAEIVEDLQVVEDLKDADPFSFAPAPPRSAPPPRPPAPKPTPAPAPTAKLPDEPVAEIFSLDADAAPVVAEEIFSLDADEIAAKKSGTVANPAAKAPAPKPAPPAAVPAGEVFSLDGDAVAEKKSGVAARPAGKPGFGSGTHPVAKPSGANGVPHAVLKPAEGRRPAVRITFVKPGQKSPFAK